MTTEEMIRNTRKQFFAYRNGIVADALRKNGDPHTMIMGCQLTDITAIAQSLPPSKAVAEAFWADTKHRECRMIAPMLYPIDEMTEPCAMQWAQAVECEEVADVLCHRLLRKLPFAQRVAEALLGSTSPMEKYTGVRLLLNLLIINKVDKSDALKSRLQAEYATATARLRPILADILEEF